MVEWATEVRGPQQSHDLWQEPTRMKSGCEEAHLLLQLVRRRIIKH